MCPSLGPLAHVQYEGRRRGGREEGKEWVGKGERGGIAFFVLATHEDLVIS